jgi:hypothetical protein
MHHHTLILSTAKLHVPNGIVFTYVTNLLHRGLTVIEYFGTELDNTADYIDQDMKEFDEKISLIDFHFGTEEAINYDSLSVIEVEKLIDDIIKKAGHIDLRANEKDITINLG